MSKARKIKKKDGKYTYEVNEVVGKNENGNPKRIYAYGATLKEAKENLYEEFSIALDIEKDNVEQYITDHL